MISTQLIRRFPFFAGFSHDQFNTLAKAAKNLSVESGHRFFQEGETLRHFYLVLDGSIAITINVPDRDVPQPLTNQITGNLINKELTVSNVGVGDVFGWSALIPPNTSTANARAVTASRVIKFDGEALRPHIGDDCAFGYLLALKAAQIVRQRLRDLRIESLSEIKEQAASSSARLSMSH
jgi:CRP-like cAMP-binding protein